MKDFYFKIQINVSSTAYQVDALRIAELIQDYYDNKLCLETDVEIRKITKNEYFNN